MSDPVFIIAEAGVNHNGSLKLAKQMIDVASECGANAIKFQTFNAESIATTEAPKAEYQLSQTNESESQFEMLKKLELDEEAHVDLLDYCNQKNIDFMSSAFDIKSLEYLNSLDLSIFKIPSGEINHIPYLRKLSQINRKTILSTGMSSLEEIKFTYNFLINEGLNRENLNIIHCTSAYPCPLEEVNLNVIKTLQAEFGNCIGYSDHTNGISVAIAAVAMGAKIIEKHFTLDKSLPGPDHKVSLNPQELEEMVCEIRKTETALGNNIKEPTVTELKNLPIARKSIVAAKDIKSGERLTELNISCKRPAKGLSPIYWDKLIGSVATKDYLIDDFIEL